MGMIPVDPARFEPGERLERSLFTRHGVKLLDAGAYLTEEVCRTLRNVRTGGLFVGDEPLRITPASASARVTVRHAEEPATPRPEPTDEERDHLRERAARIRTADRYAASLFPLWDRMPLRIDRGVHPLALTANTPLSTQPTAHDLATFRDQRIPAVRSLIARIVQGEDVHAREALNLVDELIALLTRAPQRYMHLALLAPGGLEFLPDHSYTSAATAVAIAARLGWSRADVRLAGLSALLADVGMGLVPRRIRISDRPLNEVEVNRIRRHPTFSVFLLECVQQLPESVRRTAYQHHERCDGRGYPRALTAAAICDLALVVAVADAWAAAIEPRPYKPRLRPFDAIRELIRACEAGRLDRAVVRALVESVGIFPVGSYIQLDDGELAQVMNTPTPDAIDRPVVAPLRPAPEGWTHGAPIDLAASPQRSIRRAVDPPDAVLGLQQAV